MALNINRTIDDTFYRYKMPRLIAKVEGKGNGIKTVVANMIDISKALNRPPTYPTKYFGCELGAQTQFDLKNDRFIVNGEHDAIKLQDLLDGFIRKFVLCHECDNPETQLIVKGQKITLNCKACGHVTLVDPRHRLATFVIKNPIATVADDGEAAMGIKKAKSAVKVTRVSKEHGTNGAAPVENGHNGSSDSHHESENVEGDDDAVDDDDWAVDPDDVEERQRELIGNIANITMNDDLEKSVDERLKMFMDFLKKAIKTNQALDPKSTQTEAERLDVKDEAALVICRVLFEKKPELLADSAVVQQQRALFLRFTAGNDRAQRHLLGAIEQNLCGVKDKQDREALVTKIPRVLELFYDADVLEEKQILKWGDKASSKYVSREENKEVRAKAAPFLKWLKEAEEESGGEEEEDDGIEIVYGNQPATEISKTNQNSSSVKPTTVGTKDDDFDIDDI